MEKEEIFLNEKWSEIDQKIFWTALNKKKAQKLQYVSEKAINLAKSNIPHAIDLLNIFVTEYANNKNEILRKQKHPLVYKNHMCNFCINIGMYYEKLKDWENAEKAYLKGEELFYADEQEVILKIKSKYDGYLRLAELSLELNKTDMVSKWLSKYEKVFPNGSDDNVYFFNLHKRLAYLTGEFSKSDKLYDTYLKKIENIY